MNEGATPAEAGPADVAARIARGTARATTVLAVVATLATIWLPPRVPAQDAPLYCLAMQVLSTPARFEGLITAAAPLTGSGVQLAGGLLLGGLDTTLALKLLLTLGLAVAVIAARRLARALGLLAGPSIALACAGYVGWIYAMGFFNFVVASALTAFACTSWLARETGRRRVTAWLVLAVATYVHAVAVAFAAAPYALAALATWSPRQWARRLAFFVPSAAYAVGVSIAGELEMQRIGEAQTNPTTSLGVVQSIVAAPGAALAVYSPLAKIGSVVALCILAAGAGLAIAGLSASRDAERTRRALVLTGPLVLVGYLLTPLHVSAWHFVQPRLLTLAFGAPLMACLPSRLGARVEALVTALITMVVAAGVGPALAEGLRIDEAAAQLPRERIGVAYLQIADERAHYAPVPYQMVSLHVHAYGTLGGGASYFTFPGNRHINLLRPARPDVLPGGQQYTMLGRDCAEDPVCLDPARRALRLAMASLRYDTLLLPLAPEPLVQAIAALGWQPLSPRAFRVGKSGVTLRVPPLDTPGELVARAGYPGVLGVVIERKVPAQALRRGATVELAPLPAGPVVLGAFVDDNRDGRRNQGERALITGDARQQRLTPGAPLELELRLPDGS